MKQKNEVLIIRPLPTVDPLKKGKLYLPFGPLYLAHSLISFGFTVTIIYENNEETIQKVDRIVSKNTLCFGISTMSGTQLSNAIYICTILKKKYKNIPIVWGGVHVTALPEQTLKSDLVDFIVWGEGEETIVPLITAIKNNDINSLYDMKGIGFKQGKELIIGSNSGYTDLNKTFHLPYHILDMNRHARELIIGAKRELPIWTSRGCAFRCKYCSNTSSIWPNTTVRYHTIENIVNDVKTLVNQYGADMISFADENFLLNEKRFIEILKAIRQEGIFIKYRFASRVDLLLRLKEETWKMMKEYGVACVSTSPESGSQKILDYIGKEITVKQIYQLNDILTKYDFYKAYIFLIATPQEKRDDLKKTLQLVHDLAESSISSPYPLGLHTYIPLPGTELYKDAIRYGFQPPENLEDWCCFDFTNMRDTRKLVRPWISKEDFIYIEQSIALVEKLNYEMKGPKDTDRRVFKNLLNEIKRLIAEG